MSMTMTEIERALKQLRLSGVRATLDTRIVQAQSANQAFLETFSLILQDELDRRRSRLIDRRYQQSFPVGSFSKWSRRIFPIT